MTQIKGAYMRYSPEEFFKKIQEVSGVDNEREADITRMPIEAVENFIEGRLDCTHREEFIKYLNQQQINYHQEYDWGKAVDKIVKKFNWVGINIDATTLSEYGATDKMVKGWSTLHDSERVKEFLLEFENKEWEDVIEEIIEECEVDEEGVIEMSNM